MSQKATKKKKSKKPSKPIGDGKEPKYKFSGEKGTRVRKAAFLSELIGSMFNIKFACKQVGVHRRTFYRWKVTDPVFEEACEEVDEGIKDEAEVMLQSHITEKSVASLIFYLKTKCKDRGYVERRENMHEGKIETTPLIPGTIIIEAPNDEEKTKEEGNQPAPCLVEETNEEVPEPEMPDKVESNDTPQNPAKPRWE